MKSEALKMENPGKYNKEIYTRLKSFNQFYMRLLARNLREKC